MEITQKIVALKLPEKYRFTGGVMGSGMTLGLTDGTNNGGLVQTQSLGSNTRVNQYGTTVGSDFAGTTGTLQYAKTIGITTDPEKSGITLEKEPWIVFIAY